jgi:hypothetical protein
MTTGGTSFQDLQPGDERAYDALAQVAREAMAGFLAASKIGADAGSLTAISGDAAFLNRFKELVQRRNEQSERATVACCRETAKIMRRCSIGTDVRAMSTISLAKEIRQEVFEPLDDYLKSLTELERNLDPVISKLQEGCTIPYSLMRGLRQGGKMGSGDYLEIVKEVPERLLDYACARCFGSQVSLDRQDKALEPIHAWIEQELQAPGLEVSKCGRCGKVASDPDSLNECADCGQLLCPECANAGCCGHVPARPRVTTEVDNDWYKPGRKQAKAPSLPVNPWHIVLGVAIGILGIILWASLIAVDVGGGSVACLAVMGIVVLLFFATVLYQKEHKKIAEVNPQQERPEDIMFSYWEGRINLDAEGNEATDGRLAGAKTYGKTLVCICRDGHGITLTREQLATDDVLDFYDEHCCIR